MSQQPAIPVMQHLCDFRIPPEPAPALHVTHERARTQEGSQPLPLRRNHASCTRSPVSRSTATGGPCRVRREVRGGKPGHPAVTLRRRLLLSPRLFAVMYPSLPFSASSMLQASLRLCVYG
jgi:hypothetical protein